MKFFFFFFLPPYDVSEYVCQFHDTGMTATSNYLYNIIFQHYGTHPSVLHLVLIFPPIPLFRITKKKEFKNRVEGIINLWKQKEKLIKFDCCQGKKRNEGEGRGKGFEGLVGLVYFETDIWVKNFRKAKSLVFGYFKQKESEL